MGLNPRGRGRGGKGPFSGKGRRGGGMGPPGPPFRGPPGPPGMFGPPPMGFPPGPPPFGVPPYFGGPPGGNFGPRRPPGFGKYPRKNYKGKQQQKSNETPVPEIDLTKPWVTEEIKTQDAKKVELLEAWRKSKNDDDWKSYKEQKQSVQKLYDQAKQEYIASHPEEAFYWIQMTGKVRNYFCEMCDKSFRTDDDLYMHEAEHETCGMEGCEFTAHPKIIEKHIKMQHQTGLYSRIGKLYSQEDIAKWIEERKKRYPSRKVIEEKKALEQKKIERGERIKADTNKFNKSFTQKNKTDNFKKRTTENKPANQKRERQPKKKPVVVLQPTDENVDWRGSIPPFAGIGKPSKPEIEPAVEETEDSKNFSDDEWEEIKEDLKTVEPLVPVINNTISNKISNNSLNLLACYNSDDELSDSSNGSAPEEVKTVTNKIVMNENNEKVKNGNIVKVMNGSKEVVMNGNEEIVMNESKEIIMDENNETVDGDLEIPHEKKISGRRKRRHNRGGRNNKLDRKSKFKRPRNENTETNDRCNNVRQRSLTLLEKLLSNEIRHERNVILQCVRYTVQNNFFQK